MIDISPKNLSVEDKLSLMESLWDDLCAHSHIDSPDWHKTVLDAREKAQKKGHQTPMDWQEAKAHIRKQVK